MSGKPKLDPFYLVHPRLRLADDRGAFLGWHHRKHLELQVACPCSTTESFWCALSRPPCGYDAGVSAFWSAGASRPNLNYLAFVQVGTATLVSARFEFGRCLPSSAATQLL